MVLKVRDSFIYYILYIITMKTNYPRYKLGELDTLVDKLTKAEREVFEKYLKKCSITAAPKKVKKIGKLIVQLKDVTQKGLLEQDKETIDSFLVVLNNCDKSYWTIDELKVYIKQFILFHYKNIELVENFKASGKKQLNPKITEDNLITEEEIEAMLRQAESYKESAYLLLAFQTGARPQELIDLRWRDIKFEEKYTNITLRSTKTQQIRTFPVVEKTMKALWDWKEHYSFPNVSPKDYVFISRTREKPYTTAGVNKILRRLAKKANIKKDVWGYLFRHSKATMLYEELPQQICEKLLGHKNMAGIYAHISSKKAREELLKKVYHIEELTEHDKEEIVEMKKEISDLRIKVDELLSGGYEKEMGKIYEQFEKKRKKVKLSRLRGVELY